MTQKIYDIIILGGGIAGLLLASELSSLCKVAIVEQEEVIPNKKYWLTDEQSLIKNMDLKIAIDQFIDKMQIISHEGLVCEVKGKYIIWNSRKLLKTLISKCNTNKVDIYLNSRFYTYRYKGNKVIIRAGINQISATLLVDAMGYSSPIVDVTNNVRITGYYILYGKEVQLNNKLEPIAFYNYSVSSNPVYAEIFPTSRFTAHVAIIQPTRYICSPNRLNSYFDFLINKSHLSRFFDTKEANKPLWKGIIPVGTLKKKALNNIVFFGEAGQLNPAVTATGLTRMLYCYKEYSKILSEFVLNGKISYSELKNIPVLFITEFNRKLQLSVFKSMQNWNSIKFHKFVKQFNNLDNKLMNDILFGNVNKNDIFAFNNLKTHLRFKNSILLSHSIKALF